MYNRKIVCGIVGALLAYVAQAALTQVRKVEFSATSASLELRVLSSEPKVFWYEPVEAGAGGYARAHRLNDGRVMLAYCSGTRAYFRTSADCGATWSKATRLVDQNVLAVGNVSYTNFVGNVDFAQLPANHATRPNRIIASFNYRCKDMAKRPYSILELHSDDNGASWSVPKTLFTANATEGVYEPFVHVKSDGTVEIYTADESEESLEHQNQRIAKHVSTDGGDTWGAAQTVCSSLSSVTGWSGRDGMPAVMEWNGHTYLAIETRSDARYLNPRVLTDGTREQPLAEPLASDIQGGAPYIAATENFLLLCWQERPASADAAQRRVTVAVAAKSEVPSATGSVAGLFRGRFSPSLFNGPNECGSQWNALCPLDGDDFLLVTMRCFYDGTGVRRERVYVTRGSVFGLSSGAVMVFR